VVQAFHLPKNTHVTLSHTVLSPAREIPKLADELEEPATSDAPADFLASDFVMMDADSDTEAVVGLQPEQGHGHFYVPKTMQEMAEEHAARQQQQQQLDSDADDDLDEVNDAEEETASPQARLAARPARKSKKQTTVKITLPSEASTPNNLSKSRSTKAKISSTTPNLKRKRRSSRKKVEEESDSADLTLTSEDKEDDEQQPSPSKRTRGRAATKAKRTPVVAIAPSTRTLRPRISKTTAQIEEEKQNGDDR
jgi:xeroderma pigmentosum group C-complementing protein